MKAIERYRRMGVTGLNRKGRSSLGRLERKPRQILLFSAYSAPLRLCERSFQSMGASTC